jgi:hypothetical protein
MPPSSPAPPPPARRATTDLRNTDASAPSRGVATSAGSTAKAAPYNARGAFSLHSNEPKRSYSATHSLGDRKNTSPQLEREPS